MFSVGWLRFLSVAARCQFETHLENLLDPVVVGIHDDVDVGSVVGHQVDGSDEPAVRLEVVN